MRGAEFLNAMELVDPAFVEAADAVSAVRKRRWRGWASLAACVALVAALGLSGLFGRKPEIVPLAGGETISFMPAGSPGIPNFDTAVSLTARTLTGEELEGLFSSLPVTGFALFDADTHRFAGFEGHIGEVKLVLTAGDIPLRDTVVEGAESTSMVGGVPVTAGYFVTKANSQGIRRVIYYAGFALDGCAVYLEHAGPEPERDAVRGRLVTAIGQLLSLDAPVFPQE